MLKTGEEIPVDYISTSKHGFHVRFLDEPDELVIPAYQVESLTSRWGEMLYPQNK